MDIIITPSKLNGTINAIPSKSQAHRVLICSAFSDQPTTIICPESCQDIDATVSCLIQLGADIQRNSEGFYVKPVSALPKEVDLYCKECGATLRFLLPVVAALGITATFHLEGSLPLRPLSPLWELLQCHGCSLSRPTQNKIHICGQLVPGEYILPGNISSQFITGLLFAFSLMDGTSKLLIRGKLESLPYIQMTQQVLSGFGVDNTNFVIHGHQGFISPGKWTVEGDWSNGAFFLAANSLGSCVAVNNLNPVSIQGDRFILEYLKKLDSNCTISASNIPDLIPILSVIAAFRNGAVFTDISRLRFKESDRVESILATLKAFGCQCETDNNKMVIHPCSFRGCTIHSFGDHRIVMAAAIAATVADGVVTIQDAQCVQKSYPGFWETYRALGGNYEQFSR